jgi:hypothetical protein
MPLWHRSVARSFRLLPEAPAPSQAERGIPWLLSVSKAAEPQTLNGFTGYEKMSGSFRSVFIAGNPAGCREAAPLRLFVCTIRQSLQLLDLLLFLSNLFHLSNCAPILDDRP